MTARSPVAYPAPVNIPDPPPSTELDRAGRALAAELVAALRQLGRTIALAESCTGGLGGHWLTEVPGSSRAYVGSVVAYHNGPKERLLGVPQSLLGEHGSVSAECAKAMARGARAVMGVDIAVASTGIAGPDGAGDKPAGLVFIAVADAEGDVAIERRWGTSDRSANKLRTAWAELRLAQARLQDSILPE